MYMLISFTFCCVAASSHPLYRTLERSKALWVLWDDRAPFPCTLAPSFSRYPSDSFGLSLTFGDGEFLQTSVSFLAKLPRRSLSRLSLSFSNWFLRASNFGLQRYFWFREIYKIGDIDWRDRWFLKEDSDPVYLNSTTRVTLFKDPE